MTAENGKNFPEITIKHIYEHHDADEIGRHRGRHTYSLIHNDAEIPLSNIQFHILEQLGSFDPNSLVNTSTLARQATSAASIYLHSAGVSGEQYVAENMHALSQPNLLGDIIKPEMYGPNIVGYKLAAIINKEEKMIKPANEPPLTQPIEEPRKIIHKIRGIFSKIHPH